MLILPCADLEVKSKKSGGDVVLNITIYRSELKDGKFQKLFDFQEKSISLAIAAEIAYEEFREDLKQMDFLIQCPDCASYDCLIGKKIAVCNTCKKEFAHSPEHKIPVATEEQLKDLFELAREAGYNLKDEKEEIVLILSVFAKILDKPHLNIGPGKKDPIAEARKVLKKFSKADWEICMRELTKKIHPFTVSPKEEDLIDQVEPDGDQVEEEVPEEKPEEEPVCSIDRKNPIGSTPIFEAVTSGNIEAVKILRPHNPDVNIPNPQGLTPLHASVTDGSIDIAKMLLEMGADINQRDNYGRTPLDVAYDQRMEKSIDFLEMSGGKRKFELDAEEKHGRSFANPFFGVMLAGERKKIEAEKKAIEEEKKTTKKIKYDKPSGWADEIVETVILPCPTCKTEEEMYINTETGVYRCSGCNVTHRDNKKAAPKKAKEDTPKVHHVPKSWPFNEVTQVTKYCPDCQEEKLFWCYSAKQKNKCSECGKLATDEKLEAANPKLSNIFSRDEIKKPEDVKNVLNNVLNEDGVLSPEFFKDAPF